MRLIFRGTDNSQHELTLPGGVIVSTAKERLGEVIGKSPELITFVYNGKILDEERTLTSYGVTNDVNIYYTTKVSSPKKEIPSPPTKKQKQKRNTDPFFDSPIIKRMWEATAQNPESYSELLLRNPFLKPILDKNPHIREILNDPELMLEHLRFLMSPERQEVVGQMVDKLLDQFETQVEGRKLFRDYLEETKDLFSPDLFYEENEQKTVIGERQTKPSDEPLPSLTQRPRSSDLNIDLWAWVLQGIPGMDPNLDTHPPTPTPPKDDFERGFQLIIQGIQRCREGGIDLVPQRTQPPEKKYEKQIKALQTIGHSDKRRIVSALIESNGNMYRAHMMLKKEEEDGVSADA